MLQWLSQNLATIIICLVLIFVVVLVVIKMIKDKKQGKSSCGCGCADCAMHGSCHISMQKPFSSLRSGMLIPRAGEKTVKKEKCNRFIFYFSIFLFVLRQMRQPLCYYSVSCPHSLINIGI